MVDHLGSCRQRQVLEFRTIDAIEEQASCSSEGMGDAVMGGSSDQDDRRPGFDETARRAIEVSILSVHEPVERVGVLDLEGRITLGLGELQ